MPTREEMQAAYAANGGQAVNDRISDEGLGDAARIRAGDGFGSTPEQLIDLGFSWDAILGEWLSPAQQSDKLTDAVRHLYVRVSALEAR